MLIQTDPRISPLHLRAFMATARRLLLGGCLVLLASQATLADWPQYRANAQRTAFRVQPIQATQWQPAWRSESGSPASPTWPAPARGSLWQRLDTIQPRVTHDRGDIPLIALDAAGEPHVLIAFSASDRLIALDPATGQFQWQFIAGAPIRFAPFTLEGIAYFGADDGLVRAVDIRDGRLLWQRRVGPESPWIVGNQRLIAAHPIRTSVVVQAGRLYACAGLFPSQGVYAVALDVADGSLVWRRRLEQSPQGYLLLGDERQLIIPTGRAAPIALDPESGEFQSQLPSAGGSFCMVTPEALFTGPGNSPNFSGYVQDSKQAPSATKLLPFSGQHIAAGNRYVWTAGENFVQCFRLDAEAAVWALPCEPADCMIVSGEIGSPQLFLASGPTIQVRNGLTGTLRHTLRLPPSSAEDPAARIVGLAVSASGPPATPNTLIAVTEAGTLYAWHGVPPGDQHAHHDAPSVEFALSQSFPPAEPLDPVAQSATQDASESVSRLHALSDELVSPLASDAGYALLVAEQATGLAQALVSHSRLHVTLVLPDESAAQVARNQLLSQGLYGRRIVVVSGREGGKLRFDDNLFNLVVQLDNLSHPSSDSAAAGAEAAPAGGLATIGPELERVLAPLGLYRAVSSQSLQVSGSGHIKPAAVGAGSWRHQYASPANTADSEDSLVGQAAAFRLRWFGGVGPSRMPDRHLRGPAPLAAGNSMILHADGQLLGVDPANGAQRWELQLPDGAMRYVAPLDGGYTALSAEGSHLFSAAGEELWKIDAHTGSVDARIRLPNSEDSRFWGYVAEHHGTVFATAMKPSAGRLELPAVEAREQYTSQDYNSTRPLVCSRTLFRLAASGEPSWRYDSAGVIPHSAIAISPDAAQVVLIEGVSGECREHATDRVPVKTIMAQGHLVCLDAVSGKVEWRIPLTWSDAENMLYTQIVDGSITLVSSRSQAGQAHYSVRVLQLSSGRTLWETQHTHVRSGLTHGEQVHHPLALRRAGGEVALVVEPFMYDLKTGTRVAPSAADDVEAWSLQRPGHSCGTLSGAGSCVFFRASNPTVLNLESEVGKQFTALSPSRPSCWINMIPATGLLLIPEGSASCVCNYSLQTSMAFAPLSDSTELKLLDDYPLPRAEPLEEMYRWDFADVGQSASRLAARLGNLPLESALPMESASGSLRFDGKQWLATNLDAPELPDMPRTISLAAWVRVDQGNSAWTGLVGAIQDNGAYERGCLLGIHNQQFFFGLASDSRQRLTYLESGSPIADDAWHHVAGTFDGTSMQLFVDGRLRAVSAEQSGSLRVDPQSWLAVGAYKDNDEHYPFRGALRSVSIWRGALSPQQIAVLASSSVE